jgi:hypothetical protein
MAVRLGHYVGAGRQRRRSHVADAAAQRLESRRLATRDACVCWLCE